MYMNNIGFFQKNGMMAAFFLLLVGTLIFLIHGAYRDKLERAAPIFVDLINDLCADANYNATAVLTDKSDPVEQVQAVYVFLLDAYKNKPGVLELLLKYRNYITDREWIDRFVRVDFEGTKIHFSTTRFSRDVELEKQADALIRELNP